MPTNIYGPGDNFDPVSSHVLPALIRKVAQAKQESGKQLLIWGTGTPKREFLFSDDLGDACIHLLNLPESVYSTMLVPDAPPLINIGSGQDQTIRETAELVMNVLDYQGELVFDTSRPDGTPRKLLDVSKINSLGWRAATPLADGIRKTYESVRSQLEVSVR
jgi:GDP-L-fucose synthase